ncbi:methyltransferase [Niveomyces insectorum RCEF 264]|uniref:Methyltransferase n=1 Tax=Niveomyces insectorum RCEF 264 TaxID=1081102 RepID=A0A167PI74_9HYPO|nr:methyltransferase [Niveomyces insectorum RCEF 264]
MVTRCARGPPLFLPFLYPSHFVLRHAGQNGRRTAMSRAAAAAFSTTTKPINHHTQTAGRHALPQRQHCYSTDTAPPPSHGRNISGATKVPVDYPESRLNPAPDDYATASFADKATLTIHAGSGGHGCISFLRDLFLPEGPPNGGDGGHGGNVYIQAVPGETSLHKLARRRVVRAGRGKHGQGSARNGQRGDDLVLSVPVGTVVTEPLLLAAGGVGGLGNPHFVSRATPRPVVATKGDGAVSLTVQLELRLLADVGLVGLPNAGKSTLLRAISNSRARVGSWAFTTLQPNIGTVVLDNNRGRPVVALKSSSSSSRSETEAADDGPVVPPRTRFTVADIPGLIAGAHLDKGLGIEFLRHVERAGVLAFVVDLGAGDAVAALQALWTEVGLYARQRAEDEEQRTRETRIEWDDGVAPPLPLTRLSPSQDSWSLTTADEYRAGTNPAPSPELAIAGKPWFAVATKGDLPGAEANFARLKEYLDRIGRGVEAHPSGVAGGWTENLAAIPISAIHGHGVEHVIHWTVGLLDQ